MRQREKILGSKRRQLAELLKTEKQLEFSARDEQTSGGGGINLTVVESGIGLSITANNFLHWNSMAMEGIRSSCRARTVRLQLSDSTRLLLLRGIRHCGTASGSALSMHVSREVSKINE